MRSQRWAIYVHFHTSIAKNEFRSEGITQSGLNHKLLDASTWKNILWVSGQDGKFLWNLRPLALTELTSTEIKTRSGHCPGYWRWDNGRCNNNPLYRKWWISGRKSYEDWARDARRRRICSWTRSESRDVVIFSKVNRNQINGKSIEDIELIACFTACWYQNSSW